MMTLDWDDADVEASWAVEPSFYEAPSPPNVTPRQYQLAAVEYGLARDNVIIGDAPGVGKTAECIMLGNAIEAEHTLVVCPASLRLNWEREVWLWSMIPNVRTYPVLAARDGVNPSAHYVIVSYDMLRSKGIFEALMRGRWDHLIMDEAHYLKDPRGNARTKAICGWYNKGEYTKGLVDVSGRITMATGTLTPNQPKELYNAVRLADWEAIDCASLDDFIDRYYGLGEGMVRGPHLVNTKEYGWITRTELHWSDQVRNVPRDLDDLRWRLRKHVMVRRLKEHVLPELPARQWHMLPLEPDKAIRSVLSDPAWAEAEHLWQLSPDTFDASVPIDGAVSTAYRMLGEATAPRIAEYVLELAGEGVSKIVVGAWHRSVLGFLREKLDKLGVAYMDGSTSPKRRQDEVDRFQNDPEVGIILGQQGPLGEGWTLTAAQDVILAEPWWVPGKNDQLFDRVHRYGQEGGAVTCHVPFVPGSMHERVISSVVRKDKAIHETLDG